RAPRGTRTPRDRRGAAAALWPTPRRARRLQAPRDERRAAPRRAASGRPAGRRRSGAVYVEIDHDVRQRQREPLARPVDDAALEPVRTAFRMRRDDQLVRPERADRVLDRLDGVAVTDLAVGLEAGRPHSFEAPVEPLLGGGARVVLV